MGAGFMGKRFHFRWNNGVSNLYGSGEAGLCCCLMMSGFFTTSRAPWLGFLVVDNFERLFESKCCRVCDGLRYAVIVSVVRDVYTVTAVENLEGRLLGEGFDNRVEVFASFGFDQFDGLLQ